MPRPRLRRWVTGLPKASYFKPQGVALRDLTELRLPVEGLEALRLADLEGLTTEAAALDMGVSRHTFGRVLAEARAVVARALVTGAALRIGGGHYEVACEADLEPALTTGQEAVRSLGRVMDQGQGTQPEDTAMRQANASLQGRGEGQGRGGGGGRCGRGQGQGQGQSRGIGGQGRGQQQGACGGGQRRGAGGPVGRGGVRTTAAGAEQPGTDLCVCPQCGQRAPHTPGTPCTSMTCPACGTAMIRQQP
jgi:predicted DNA-binding protein (UPF0251 family)